MNSMFVFMLITVLSKTKGMYPQHPKLRIITVNNIWHF